MIYHKKGLEDFLPVFFDQYKFVNSRNKETQSLTDFLPCFFEKYSNNFTKKPKEKMICIQINFHDLSTFFGELCNSITSLKEHAFLFDPWELIRLDRNEVRNTAILAWILDPRGGHGLGNKALCALLEDIACLQKYSRSLDNSLIVRKESNPDGYIRNRVDIEIESNDFYLIIEVKIDANESIEQLKKYGDLAKSRAGDRPWLILFLTTNAIEPSSAGIHLDSVKCISWENLSIIIYQALFANHSISNESFCAQRIMINQLIKHFLSHIRNF